MLFLNMNIRTESSNPPEMKPSTNSWIQKISEYLLDPDSGLTFESWFQKCEDIFHMFQITKSQTTLTKIRHCWTQEIYEFYSSEETVLILSKLFGEWCLEFQKCCNCLTVARRDDEDWMNYVSRINSDFEKWDFKSICNDHYKCLLFACGHRNAGYADFQARILKIIEGMQEIFQRDLDE